MKHEETDVPTQAQSQTTGMRPPNILLITTDTQRWDTLRCMGNPKAISPHLDRLAQEGILFTNAHTSSPVCSPTRCTLLTGLHTPIHGAVENGIPRRNDLITFPDLLAEAGYTNIMAGKTHFGPLPDSFSIDFSTGGGKSGRADDIYRRHLLEHGYEGSNQHPNPIPEDLFYDAFVTTKTIEGIEAARQRGDGPFFAFCSMVSPHGPLDPPGRWADLYTDDMLQPLPKNPNTDAEPQHTKRLLGLFDRQKRTPEEINLARRLYYGLAAYCDHQVGRLMRYLDTHGLREETLIIFSSDHGIDLYDHGFDDKHHYYDNTWRVPLIMSMPNILSQNRTREFAIWNDIPTTILGAAGVTEPTMQGFDLFTPLKNGEPSPRNHAVGTLYKSCALATRRWKYEYYFEAGEGRLFDRQHDPGEYNDLSQSQAHRMVQTAMKEALLTWRADLHDIAHLQTAKGGGPVAMRVAEYVKDIRGVDAEERLNRKVEAIDEAFGCL